MKKFTSLALALLLVVSLFAFAACGNKTDDNTIVVGASSTPHAEILEQVKGTLAEQGYTLDIRIFDDYILPNTSLDEGDLDANYFQHKPYLDSFNAQNGTKIASAAAIHYEPFGLYGNGITSLENIPAGTTIIVPADDSNETRALFLLEQEGLIELAEDATIEKGVTILDIADNKGYDVRHVQADTVPAVLYRGNTEFQLKRGQLPPERQLPGKSDCVKLTRRCRERKQRTAWWSSRERW